MNTKKKVGYKQNLSMLKNWKKQEYLDFLTKVIIISLQQGLRHLQATFTNFFGGQTKYPNFKKKPNGRSSGLRRQHSSVKILKYI